MRRVAQDPAGLLAPGARLALAQGVTVAAGAATGLLLARGLGAAGYGQYAVAIAVVQLLLVPLNAGLPTLVTRELAVMRARGDRARAARLMRWSAGAAGLVLAAVLAGWALWRLARPGGTDGALWLAALVLAGLWAYARLAAAGLRGLEAVVPASLPDQVIRPLVLLGLVAAGAALGGLTPARAIGLHAAAAGAALLWGGWALARRWAALGPAGARLSRGAAPPDWRRALAPLALVVAAGAVNDRADILVLGLLHDPAEAGVYGLAALAAGAVAMPRTIVNTMLAPKIARLHAQGARSALARLVARGGALASLGAAGLLALLAVFGGPLIALAAGPGFEPALPVALLLGAGAVLATLPGPVTPVLLMTGHERAMARLLWAGAALNVALTLALVPVHGAAGAAAATLAAGTVREALLWRAARARTGLRCDVGAALRPRRVRGAAAGVRP